MNDLVTYARRLLAGTNSDVESCEVFAKVLTTNDDSGRHGLLIPSDGYGFFPELVIENPEQNATATFIAFNSLSGEPEELAYKYYARYPERRVTRLPKCLNEIDASPRIAVFLRAKSSGGTFTYCFDCASSVEDGRFDELYRLVFGSGVAPVPGRFVIRPVDSVGFAPDKALDELLVKFDHIKGRGWIDSLRTGDTGIGYTFETLLGIQENNDQHADFNGIEIKCKGAKEDGRASTSKLNLFQAAPTWLAKMPAKERIRLLGRQNDDGRYSCYSQVTVVPNNLGLVLEVLRSSQKIDLRKCEQDLGFWTLHQLGNRLAQKHSRAAFVKARVKQTKTKSQYWYDELVYCDRPSVERFITLVDQRNIVFEFTMSEKSNGSIRNHGYPWRLIGAEYLDHLFSFQIKLR